MTVGGVGGGRSTASVLPRPTSQTQTSSEPSPQLKTLIASNPQLQTNQDLINHCYQQGGNTWEGAQKVAKDLGTDLNQLVKARDAALPREAQGASQTPASGRTVTNDAFVNGDRPAANVTGRQGPQFSAGDQTTQVPVDSTAQQQLAAQRQQAHLGGTKKTATEEESKTRDNIETNVGAKDASAEHVGPELRSAPSISRGRSGTVSREWGNGGTTTTRQSTRFNGTGNQSSTTNTNADYGTRGQVRSRTTASTTTDADGTVTSSSQREATTTRNGRTQQSLTENVSVSKDGRTLSTNDRLVENNGRVTGTHSESDRTEATRSRGERAREAVTDTVKDAKATIYHREIKLAEGEIGGEAVKNFNNGMKIGTDPGDWKKGKFDGTGAGAKLEVLTYEANAGYGAYAQNGKLHAGADISGSANLVSVSGRAQAGTSTSVTGAVSAQGEAKVGLEGQAGGRVSIDLSRNPTVEVSAGVKAFAGAKAEGSVSYQNRYVGVTAKGEASAGIGGEAGAHASLKNGRLKAGVSLSGTLGLGAGAKVEIDVNVGAIAKDSWEGAKAAGSWVGDKLGWW